MADSGEAKLQPATGAGSEPPTYQVDEKPGDIVESSETYTGEEERAVLRKIDYTILPMVRLCHTYAESQPRTTR